MNGKEQNILNGKECGAQPWWKAQWKWQGQPFLGNFLLFPAIIGGGENRADTFEIPTSGFWVESHSDPPPFSWQIVETISQFTTNLKNHSRTCLAWIIGPNQPESYASVCFSIEARPAFLFQYIIRSSVAELLPFSRLRAGFSRFGWSLIRLLLRVPTIATHFKI